ncbi:CRISPR-associated helicase Cas3' [Streptomyces sp. NPDC057617]|uniref:CRISPR-associated helicase Cas3' n=1 Tax=Streptomyces sp. NPDC057617 TaxID=3346184 RepID=UPI0036CA967E
MADALFDVVPGPHCQRELTAALEPLGDARGWAAVLCGLHDLGKCSPTFQGLRADLVESLLPAAPAADVRRLMGRQGIGKRLDTHHGVLTALHLHRILTRWGASPKVSKSLAWALGGHHGVIPESATVQQARYATGEHGCPWWAGACDALVATVAKLWGLAAPEHLPWEQVRLSPEAVVALAGLTSTSDWIASSRAQADYSGPEVDLSGYLAEARRTESVKLAALQWLPWTPPRESGFAALFPQVQLPFPVQTAVERAVAGMRGPGIVVVSAPTGEGKTKAALQASTAMVGTLGLRGFYVAMPSRVTSNQVYDVTEQFLSEAGDGAALRLLHAAAKEYLKGRTAQEPLLPRDVGVDGPGDGDGEGSEWFAGKRGLLAPLGVGTVDQVLMAGLRSTHVFVRLLGLSGKAVVFDEVHGYDVHMSRLLDRVVWWLGRLRVPVVLLSATLPSRRQEQLVASWRAGALGVAGRADEPSGDAAVAYPRVVWADVGGVPPRQIAVKASKLNRDRPIRLERVSLADHATWALKRAQRGQCVAIVHNLVRCAVAVYKELAKAISELPEENRPELVLLHAQLTAAERASAETAVRTRFGPPEARSGERPTSAIVVGTQLLEQGIDVDFDVMISALAPVDSLIQRMGRIQRHSRRGPLLLALTGVRELDSKVEFPQYTTLVYDEAVLLRTWALLRGRVEVRCPEEVQVLVDAVYGEQTAVTGPPGWRGQWDRAAARHEGRRRRDEAEAVWLRLPQPREDLQVQELTRRPGSARRTRIQRGEPREA